MAGITEHSTIMNDANFKEENAHLSDASIHFGSSEQDKTPSDYELDDVLDLYNDTTEDDADDADDVNNYIMSPSSSLSSESEHALDALVYPIYSHHNILEHENNSDYASITPSNHPAFTSCAYLQNPVVDSNNEYESKFRLSLEIPPTDFLSTSTELSKRESCLSTETSSSKFSAVTAATITNETQSEKRSSQTDPSLPFKTNSLNCDVTYEEGPLTKKLRGPKKYKPSHSSWDIYGFKKANQFYTVDQYNTWYGPYSRYLERREQRWNLFLQENGIDYIHQSPSIFPSRSAKTQRFIRKGIPPEYRGNAWFYYSGGYELLQRNPKLYETLWRCACIKKPSDSDLIERDLYRTFPDNVHFRHKSKHSRNSSDASEHSSEEPDVPMISKLRRVLMTFATYLPENGYCQSLNFLAGFFLLFMSEEKAFWMLVITCRKYLPKMHDANLEGANIDQSVLMASVRESLPAVWSRISLNFDGIPVNDIVAKLPPITLVTAAWFMSAFVGILPTETALRVWDCFFYEGSKVLFMTALCILRLGEDDIKSKSEQTEVFQVIQDLPKSLLDANAFLSLCFRRNFRRTPSQKDIERRREKVAKKRNSSASKLEMSDSSKHHLSRSSSRFSKSHIISQLHNHLKKST
ncbi:GTPase-activating protein gyp3 [Schizosaccharomyces pombe]